MTASSTPTTSPLPRRQAFDPTRLQRRYSFLGDIPEALYAKVVTCLHGRLEDRVAGLKQWRTALSVGELPNSAGLVWPTEPHADALLHDPVLREVASFCRSSPELIDSVLESVLDAVASGDAAFHRVVEKNLEELRGIEEARRRTIATQRKQQRESSEGKDQGSAQPDQVEPEPLEMTPDELERLRDRVQQQNGGTWSSAASDSMKSRWSNLLAMWREISDVFGELGLLTGLGRDLSLGVLKSRGWTEAKRLAELLRQLPQLREIVRSLGRLQTVKENDPAATEIVYQPVRRVREELREVRTPFVPSEMRGIERSDSIPRMLPSEAVLLTHPVLKLLWHARRAERALLTYRVEGVATEIVEIEEPGEEGTAKPLTRDKLERGPIIICLDTSGSMEGAPETVAKALVLEAVRVAHSELRQCFLYAFSGPGQVLEHELSLKAEGVEKLLAFLAMSFGGGTDVAAPLTSAATRLGREGWNKADIVLVSDGEFPVPAEAEKALRQACMERKARVHGVLIGAATSPAMEKLCEPLHRFSDWQAMTYVK